MTIIAKGAEVNGSMDVEGNIRVDGTVIGDVRATEGVEVGKSGRIVGSAISSKTAVIHGYVESHLTVSQHVLLGGKSTLVGDLKTKSLVIEEGAVFHGNSSMAEEYGGDGRESGAGAGGSGAGGSGAGESGAGAGGSGAGGSGAGGSRSGAGAGGSGAGGSGTGAGGNDRGGSGAGGSGAGAGDGDRTHGTQFRSSVD